MDCIYDYNFDSGGSYSRCWGLSQSETGFPGQGRVQTAIRLSLHEPKTLCKLTEEILGGPSPISQTSARIYSRILHNHVLIPMSLLANHDNGPHAGGS